ncbi:MAG: hypothetical protein V4496_03605 [Pseudomonadota bacterium]
MNNRRHSIDSIDSTATDMPGRLHQNLIPSHSANNAPQVSYRNTLAAGFTVVTQGFMAWGLLNLAAMLWLKTGYPMFYTAGESMKQWSDYSDSLEDNNVVNPQKDASANAMSNGRGQITIHNEQVPAMIWTAKASAALISAILIYVATSIIVASFHKLTPGLNPTPKKDQHQFKIDEETRVKHANEYTTAGAKGAKEPQIASYYYGFWERYYTKLPDDATFSTKLAHRMIEAPHSIPQDFWDALVYTLSLGLPLLVMFEVYFEIIGLPVFNDTKQMWADDFAAKGTCNGTIAASQCLGTEGNYAQQAEFHRIDEAMVSNMVFGLYCAAILLTASPLITYFGKLIYNNVTLPAMPTLPTWSREAKKPTVNNVSVTENLLVNKVVNDGDVESQNAGATSPLHQGDSSESEAGLTLQQIDAAVESAEREMAARNAAGSLGQEAAMFGASARAAASSSKTTSYSPPTTTR